MLVRYADKIVSIGALALVGVLITAAGVYANSTSNFTQVINAGTLAIDIVDSTGAYATVANPSVTFPAQTFSFSSQTSASTFGTATETIYVSNPDAADNGWHANLAATNTTDLWDSALPSAFDFNDPTASAADGGDADTVGGQLTVDAATGGTLTAVNCSSCSTANISLGASAAFSEGVTDSIQLIDAAAGADDIGQYSLTGVDVSQTIPAEQDAANDYNIDMVLSVTAY